MNAMTETQAVSERLIERPDGSTIHYDKLKPEKQIEHDAATGLCHAALTMSAELMRFKHQSLAEMVAARVMMFEDHGVKKGGAQGNLSLRSVCGRYLVKMTVAKHITFGPQLEAAKALIDEFMTDELGKGGSEIIHEIVTKVFRLNGKGRIDRDGILGLREHRFEDDRWTRAMDAIDEAICRDSSTTYVNFYTVDPASGAETRIPLDLAGV
ncbi:hypothetical protein AN189_02970 [Loktanella sp. 3ANDIMAR09]|uniref:DUF3164 family protein n=1 Tax=Loktanella sp. 3ANDIMAR09 TaxID=1225657 RepID=UPI0006F948DE|nr:DUF3164 family protein [Loktanella sp. 3ANDIMAR09]KQI69399.1 hypothetical protein AN189_02970 [Loktanella sp. 3ANDIMAR09]